MKPVINPGAGKSIRKLAIVSLLILAGCNSFTAEDVKPPANTIIPTSVRTPPAVVVSTQTPEFAPVETNLPTPTLAPPAPETQDRSTIACPGITCVWKVDQDPPELITFDGQIETAYDYSPSTQRLLHGKFTGLGAGPGNVAVTDLQFLDLKNGMNRQIIPEENIVEAVWAPDGKHLAYVKSTSTTYELHWMSELGEDRLLASDVAFTFSVSPSGDRVAFTRESNYNINGQPGLYVVDIASGEEWSISDFDREGTGSISDRPIWNSDGSQIILPAAGILSQPGFVRAAVEGSRDNILNLTPSIQEVIGRGSIGANLLWHPDNRHLIGQVYPDMLGSDPNRIFLFELDPALEQLISAELILEGEGELVGWAEPGVSIWVMRQFSDLILVPLP